MTVRRHRRIQGGFRRTNVTSTPLQANNRASTRTETQLSGATFDHEAGSLKPYCPVGNGQFDGIDSDSLEAPFDEVYQAQGPFILSEVLEHRQCGMPGPMTELAHSHRSMKRFSASLLCATPSSLRCRSSARRVRVSPSFSFSALAPPLPDWSCGSCLAPNNSVSSHRRRNSSDSAGDIEGGAGCERGGLSPSVSSRSTSLKLYVAPGPTVAFGGGDDGGVDVDKCRWRWTSPRNTLPMCDIT